jgi:hypothetical protein
MVSMNPWPLSEHVPTLMDFRNGVRGVVMIYLSTNDLKVLVFNNSLKIFLLEWSFPKNGS